VHAANVDRKGQKSRKKTRERKEGKKRTQKPVGEGGKKPHLLKTVKVPEKKKKCLTS